MISAAATGWSCSAPNDDSRRLCLPADPGGRKGGCPTVKTPAKLRRALCLMADRIRSIPTICRKPGDMPASTICHDLHADGTPKGPARELLDPGMRAKGGASFIGRRDDLQLAGRAHALG